MHRCIATHAIVFQIACQRVDDRTLTLYEAYTKLNKKGAPGLNKVTAAEYRENLEQNLIDLHNRLKGGRYRAPPVKRVLIEKESGKKRALGIPEFEDKIVQRAVEMLLSAIYEGEFYDFSHGFRKGRSQHKALHELREQCHRINVNRLLSADITGLFDNINHDTLRELIKRRVNDGGILRLIGKWLNAGVMEEDRLEYDTAIELIALADELEAFIRSVIPKATTVSKYGGKLFTLKPEEKEGQFCGVFIYKAHVQISFSKGAHISDENKLLLGSGQLRRHINFRSIDDVSDNDLRKLLERASRL